MYEITNTTTAAATIAKALPHSADFSPSKNSIPVIAQTIIIAPILINNLITNPSFKSFSNNMLLNNDATNETAYANHLPVSIDILSF